MKAILKSSRSIVLLMLAWCIAHSIQAQSHFNINGELQRPSTNTWEMIRYGEVGANLYTGTVQLNIPFYEYKDNDFTIPVSFRYSSNGCQPNLRAGIMGPGWTLDAGGAIAAEINGLPDDKGAENIKSYFELCSRTDGLPEASQLWRPVLSYSSAITIGCYPTALIYCTGGRPNSTAPNYEAVPDFFHFNFLGYSGTFHFGLNGKVHIYNTNIPDKNFRISFNGLRNNYFLIETPDGYKYTFSANDRVEEYSAGDLKRRISWLLTKITAPNGRTVTMEYDFGFGCLCEPASYDLTGRFYDFVLDDAGTTSPPMESGQQREHYIVAKETYNLHITSIKISDGPTIRFHYDNLGYGNRLTGLAGSSGGAALGASYSYDAGGNMTYDGRRGIGISYNILNLPARVSEKTGAADGAVKAVYLYSADGMKQSVADASGSDGYLYLGSLVLAKGGEGFSLASTGFGGGRIIGGTDGSCTAYYYGTDHLGSVRIITDGSGGVVERNDYYPLGARNWPSPYT